MADPEYAEIALQDINADNNFNCREKISQIETLELAKSIRERGLLQAVILRKHLKNNKQYQLIAGYRRFTAYGILNQEDPIKYGKIKAGIIVCDDLEAIKINMTENIQRTNLNIKEEAHCVQRLAEAGYTRAEACKELGMSMGWLQGRIELLELPEDIQNDCVTYKFTGAIIRELSKMKTNEERYERVKKIKNLKEQGEKVVKAERKQRPLDKLIIPKREDIYDQMQKVKDSFGKYNIVTRAMAWCTGSVTDRDFEKDVVVASSKSKAISDILTRASNGENIQEAARAVLAQ